MKQALISAVVVATGLALNGSALARGGSSGHSSSSSYSSSSSSSSTRNSTTFYSKNNTTPNSFVSKNTSTTFSGKNNGQWSKGSSGSKSGTGSNQGKFTKSCKNPYGKYCGSGWCFPKDCCPYWSRCIYSSDWGCDIYYVPSYTCWVWFCEADGCYYQICE